MARIPALRMCHLTFLSAFTCSVGKILSLSAGWAFPGSRRRGTLIKASSLLSSKSSASCGPVPYSPAAVVALEMTLAAVIYCIFLLASTWPALHPTLSRGLCSSSMGPASSHGKRGCSHCVTQDGCSTSNTASP